MFIAALFIVAETGSNVNVHTREGRVNKSVYVNKNNY